MTATGTATSTASVPTPGGQLTLVVRGDVILAAGFAPIATFVQRMKLQDTPPTRTLPPAISDAIDPWLDGDIAALDRVLVDQPGTDFQHQVWDALRKIPAGETATYGQIAAQVGRPGATRAVGSACGRNLIAPFVPCHRAVRADGGLGGYAYGLEVKRWLLTHEAREVFAT